MVVRPGNDLCGVETVEGLHLAEDVPHHLCLRKHHHNVAITILIGPVEADDERPTLAPEGVVQQGHHAERRGQAGSGGQKVQQQAEVLGENALN